MVDLFLFLRQLGDNIVVEKKKNKPNKTIACSTFTFVFKGNVVCVLCVSYFCLFGTWKWIFRQSERCIVSERVRCHIKSSQYSICFENLYFPTLLTCIYFPPAVKFACESCSCTLGKHDFFVCFKGGAVGEKWGGGDQATPFLQKRPVDVRHYQGQ